MSATPRPQRQSEHNTEYCSPTNESVSLSSCPWHVKSVHLEKRRILFSRHEQSQQFSVSFSSETSTAVRSSAAPACQASIADPFLAILLERMLLHTQRCRFRHLHGCRMYQLSKSATPQETRCTPWRLLYKDARFIEKPTNKKRKMRIIGERWPK